METTVLEQQYKKIKEFVTKAVLFFYLFIYSIIYLYQCELWIIIQYVIYVIVQIGPDVATVILQVVLQCASIFASIFLLFGTKDIPGLSGISPAFVLEPTIPPRTLVSFNGVY